MGYNNPAFVDDDNKSSNAKTTIELNDKNISTIYDGIEREVVSCHYFCLFCFFFALF